jgi:hypothetical protein
MERKLSTLDFAVRQRPYVKSPSGTFQSERNYLDFVIDGLSVAERTRYDLVSVLCKEWVSEEREKSVRRLLREEAADFPDDRRSLLVCPECGDIGCGAVSIIIDVSDSSMLWRDFGYQNTYEPEIHGAHLKDFGPFEFELSDYRSKLSHALELLKAPL